jgi:hypothetical protein
MADRPPGREREGGPVFSSPSRPAATPPLQDAEVVSSVAGGSLDQAVAAKLWRLHWDHGYFTRAEIEAALGLDQRESAA